MHDLAMQDFDLPPSSRHVGDARPSPAALVAGVQQLFSLPDVAMRLNALMENPEVTHAEIIDVLQLDAGLTATVLRLANSAWYGLPQRIDTLARAITLIGLSALRDLVLASALIKRFEGIPGEFVNMKTFWDNSVACGVTARNLARECRLRDTERLFLAGLLHKIGRLVFFVSSPREYRQVLARAGQDESALPAAEREVFGFCYAELGGALLQAWQLPELLVGTVTHHLDSGCVTPFPRERAILQVAADMAGHLSPDIKLSPSEIHYTPDFEDTVWTDLRLSPDEVGHVAAYSMLQIYELIEIINPRA